MKEKWEGVISILLTPFKEDQELDLDAFSHLVDFNACSGVHGVVVLGSNGEFPYLTFDEKIKLIKSAVDVVNKRIQVIVGASAFGTKEAISLGLYSKSIGADALLVALPTYWKITFNEAYEHYKTLAQKVHLPIFYYHFPALTHLELKEEQYVKILSIDGIVGTKNSLLNMSYLKRLINLAKNLNSSIFTGVEFNFFESLKLGACGVMGPLANIWPQKLVQIFQSFKEGNLTKAENAQLELFHLMPLTTGIDMPPKILKTAFSILSLRPPLTRAIKAKTKMMAMFKEMLRQQGHPIKPVVRTPLQPLEEKDKEIVSNTLAKIKTLASS